MTVRVKKSDPPETTRKAIVILIQAATKLSRRDIEAVLDAQKRLAGWYCR